MYSFRSRCLFHGRVDINVRATQSFSEEFHSFRFLCQDNESSAAGVSSSLASPFYLIGGWLLLAIEEPLTELLGATICQQILHDILRTEMPDAE